MYIAFKWLVSLSFLMWVLICFVDYFMKGPIRLKNTGAYNKSIRNAYKNLSMKNEYKIITSSKEHIFNKEQSPSVPYLYFSMFMAGALCVSVFHKKQDIIVFAQRKISSTVVKRTLRKFKKTALILKVAISQYLQDFVEQTKMVSLHLIKKFKVKNASNQNKIHLILLNKLKEMGEERKNLGQLLIAAIQENKNIRMRYQLETMTKNRLVQHIENTQKEMKENRSRYVSFQQLYLATYQENNFLKARIRKLKKDKDDAEINFMALINEVYRSNNRELKAYCTRFIVKTKDNLLNSDVRAEITEFLERNETPSHVKSSNDLSLTHSWSSCTRITEVFNEENSLVPLVLDAPKLKGLPGEYVWTVKDKNGIIEKLYEYDYESSMDNGDTIKRIRQYSVYYDKDCLLDFSKLDQDAEAEFLACSRPNKLDHPSNPRFVTGSKAFQRFLQNNNSVVPTKTTSSLLWT